MGQRPPGVGHDRVPPMSTHRHRTILVALLAVAPALGAQELAAPARDSLQVRPGDTLWGLARDHLRDPFRWSDILALNLGAVRDPHWIYPGQRLRLPGGAATPTPDLAFAEASEAPEAAISELGEEPPSSASLAFRTVRPPLGAEATVARDTTRTSGWFAVPYVATPGAPRGAGHVVAGSDIGPQSSRAATRRFQRYDGLVLTLPADVAPVAGNAVLLVRRGPDLRDGQVLMPTGIAVIESDHAGLARARLTHVFDVVEAGQAVVALPSPAATEAGASVPLESRIAWVAGSPELPTLYSAVVLAAGAREGVREGDRFELVAEPAPLGEQARLPEVRAAVVRVVRVTEFGATAVIVSQQQPAVNAGMRVRRITDAR